MYVLPLLAALASSFATDAGQARAATMQRADDPTRVIAWSFEGRAHRLPVRAVGDDLVVVGRPQMRLRSAVGPFVSLLEDRTWVTESGGYRTQKIVVETYGTQSFDLITWLDRSNQSGVVMSQLVQGPRCMIGGDCEPPRADWPARPQCPSLPAVQRWDGGFVELANALVEAGCFTDQEVGIQSEGFWIDSFDGERIGLAVQREHCEAARSACGAVVSFVMLRPPTAWLDWLEQARDGGGYLPRVARRLSVPLHPGTKMQFDLPMPPEPEG